ncbi:MAG TPA: acyl-CoA dehydrogenase family protein [Myxococcota bacterium]|nr:acyl-CoA dehydrogenase family protein [Myxococcota bacterium]
MDLDFSEEQTVLRDMVRGVLAEHSPIEVVRRTEDDPIGYPEALWKQLAEVGVTGILIPESFGGAGQTLLEAAIVYEELGRALAPTPHFPSAVICASVLLAAGSEAQQRAWLPRIASGEAIVTPAWLEPDGSFRARGVQLRATPSGDGFELSGRKRHVAFARAAAQLLVLARTGPGDADIDLFLIDPGAKGISQEQQLSLASDAQYELAFERVRVPASARVGAPGTGWQTFERAMQDGIVLLAAQAMGGAERALEITVEYAKERKQFDKPLGAFQAISHYLADASTKIDGGKTLVYEAAWARSTGRDASQLAAMAKLFACQTYRDVTAMCQQVWGGVGFTIEYDIQLFFRRAKQLQLSWWDSRELEERIAAAVLDGPAA